MIHKTKMFVEERVMERQPGAAPGDWKVLRQTRAIDQLVNDWVDETGMLIVFATSPGIDIRWLNKEMTIRSIIVSVMIGYAAKEKSGEPSGDEQQQWPEFNPGAEAEHAPDGANTG